MAIEFLGIAPMGSGIGAGDRPATRPTSAAQAGELVMDLVRRNLHAARDHHARGDRERHRVGRRAPAARPTPCCTCWRSRARSASTLDIDDFDRDQPRRRRCSPTSSRAAGSWRPICTAPAASALVAKRLLDAGLLHADRADGHRPDASAKRPPRPTRRRARKWSGRSTSRSSRPAASSSCKGNLAPEGCVVKIAGHEPHASSRPGARLRQRGGGVRGGARATRSSRTTWW